MKGFRFPTFAFICLFALVARVQADAPPTISDFSPADGPVGTTVVIDGTGFVPPISITFAGNAAASGSFTSTKITATVPSGAATGPITITTANGSVTTTTNFTLGAAAIPVVTLAATVPSTTLGSGQPGVFTVSIPSPLTTGTNVNYTLSGSARNGTDYTLLTGTVKIKKNTTSRNMNIVPQGNLGGAAKKTVKLTLISGDGYTVGTTTFEKVKIVAGQ